MVKDAEDRASIVVQVQFPIGIGVVKVHRTGMVGGVRWIGAANDQKRGNSTGKAVIESFNRQLHKLLLHLPGQRGNHADNEPQNMGALGKSRYHFEGKKNGRQNGGTMIDEDEYLAQLNLATGGTMKLRLNSLYFRELEEKVREAIARHNTEGGHGYRGHGTYEQVEVDRGVWKDRRETSNIQHPTPNIQSGQRRTYQLRADATESSAGWTMAKKEIGAYWHCWNRVVKVRPDLDRHAITRRVLGCNVSHKDLSRAQWAKLLRAFAAIVREAKGANDE